MLLRYAQDLAWFHSAARGFERAWYAERGLTWLVRAAEVEVLAPVAVGDELVGTTRVVGWRRVWARRRTDFVDAGGRARRLDPHRLGAARRARRADAHPGRVRARCSARPTRRSSSPGSTLPTRRPRTPRDVALRGPAAGARPDGPRQQRGLRRLARRGGHRRRRRGRPIGAPAAGSSTPARPKRVRRSTVAWSEGADSWAFRLADQEGADLLGARLTPAAGTAAR